MVYRFPRRRCKNPDNVQVPTPTIISVIISIIISSIIIINIIVSIIIGIMISIIILFMVVKTLIINISTISRIHTSCINDIQENITVFVL